MKPTIRLMWRSLWALVPHLDGREDMPLRDVAVLLFILEKKEPSSSPDIQTALNISQPKVSTIGGRLVSAGLVEKYRDAGGRVVFGATDKGRAAQASILAILSPKGASDEVQKRDMAE